jgi:hypothetical protein
VCRMCERTTQPFGIHGRDAQSVALCHSTSSWDARPGLAGKPNICLLSTNSRPPSRVPAIRTVRLGAVPQLGIIRATREWIFVETHAQRTLDFTLGSGSRLCRLSWLDSREIR